MTIELEKTVVARAPAIVKDVNQFILEMNRTINSTNVPKRYVYVIEHLWERNGAVYKREVYDNFTDLIKRGLENYEIPYQIANADEAAYYFDETGVLCENYCDYYNSRFKDENSFLPRHLLDLASYMVCDMLSKGKDYVLVYDGEIVVRRTTVKKLEALKIKEEKLKSKNEK